ncbi:MAG: aldose 1-epimerase family protein [Candidatus Dormibacteraceae bacterium]
MTAVVTQRPHLGDLSQIASGRQIRLGDGPEDGVRAIDVRVAGGIHALVIADRGLDIGPAWYGGYPLAWQSPTGIVHPSYFRDDVWLRSFHGGLLFTAGLQNVGSAVRDGDEEHGLHGRLSNLPARKVVVETIEDGRGLALVIRGEVRETTVYGVDLVLHRTLRFQVGEPLIELHDEVENRGFAPAPIFILYHINLGHPVVDSSSRLVAPVAEVAGWDDVSRAGEPEHARFVAPSAGFKVQVFEHRLSPSAPDLVRAGVVNPEYAPSGGIGVVVDFHRAQLPRLWQWRMLAEGIYVTGIEPANCGLFGRVAEREAGPVTELAAGERRSFDIMLRAAIGPAVHGLAAGA